MKLHYGFRALSYLLFLLKRSGMRINVLDEVFHFNGVRALWAYHQVGDFFHLCPVLEEHVFTTELMNLPA